MDSSRSRSRLFHALLYFYPAAFRHEYGPEMERLFADRSRSERGFGLWIETIADIGFSAPQEHWHFLTADLRYASRTLAASPGFTAIAILVIALGIGATASIFSLVNAVLLRSLPYGHPEQLVYLWSPNSRFQGTPQEMAPNVPDVYDWQRLSGSFSGLTMLRQKAMTIVSDGLSSRVEAALVTGNFFQTMEASTASGRSIDANDDRPGREQVAVISDRLWRARLNSAADAIGKHIQLNRKPYLVIGVMPRDFGYPFEGDIPYGHAGFKQTDVWLPIALTAIQKSDRSHFESTDAAIGRLRSGVSAAGAESELKVIESRLDSLYPDMWKGWTALAKPLVATIIGPVEEMFWLLLGAVGVVLLIAISNVANLLFARASARGHEIGIRTALGSGRARIVRQLLTESLLLSCIGGSLGVALAYAAVHTLVRLNPGDIPRFDTAAIDGRVLLVALLLSIGTGLASGLAPALFASSAGIHDLLKTGGNRGSRGSSSRARSTLIVLEVALSVVLLAGAGLLIRSYLQLARVDPGFSPGTLTFRVDLDEQYSTPESRASFFRKYLATLQHSNGMSLVGAADDIPLTRHESMSFVEVRGSRKTNEMVETRAVTPDYLKALGTPLLLGRSFMSRDVDSNLRPVLVNRKFADTYFKGRNAIGQQVKIGMQDVSGTPWSLVIGVVGDIRHNKLDEDSQPQIFQPTDNGQDFVVQCASAILPALEQARAALRSLDPALTLADVRTMRERINESNARRRFQTTLMTGFGAIAIALALAGLYGLMSYSVKERTAEIGIRLALGCSNGRVVGLILWQGVRLTALGLLLGLCTAIALTRLVSAWLFGVKAFDPITFIAVPIFVLLVACLACWIAARNATDIDPAQALRQ